MPCGVDVLQAAAGWCITFSMLQRLREPIGKRRGCRILRKRWKDRLRGNCLSIASTARAFTAAMRPAARGNSIRISRYAASTPLSNVLSACIWSSFAIPFAARL
jgi:hypothetical protein